MKQDSPRKPLRLWPGVVALVLLWVSRFGLKMVIPGFEGFRLGMMISFAAMAVLLLWWLFLSRAPWAERLGALALMVGGLYLTSQLAHDTMGPVWLVGYAVPGLFLALVGWAVLSRKLDTRARRSSMVVVLLLASLVWAPVRTEGIDGDHVASFAWRWSPTAEERLLAQSSEPSATPTTSAGSTETPDSPSWPGFRGTDRDGVVHGVRIATDWAANPPVELWRQPVGPGWSSFAVAGDRFYTQEQRGDEEAVSAYDTVSGELLWLHADPVRFFESNAGAGPRSTPALADGRVYTLGATGIVNALDAGDGTLVWSRNAADDTGATLPVWGFSGSPLVVGDVLLVPTSGTLVAYDTADGIVRWKGPKGGESYSSPQRVSLDGVEQALFLSAEGARSFDPVDGTLLWEHAWGGFPMLQPAQTADGDLLLSVTQEKGTRRLAVNREGDAWRAEELWTSTKLKPYFNDFVPHQGHVYGFDGRILACLDAATGERRWKGGRYGNGQLVLLAEQDLLLVLSEKGELALVSAKPDGFEELARTEAITGKTWNHPVVTGDLLLVRNAEEMAAFRLPDASG